MRIKSLITRLVFYFIIVALAPLLIAGYITYDRVRAAMEQQTFRHLNTAATLKGEELDRWLVDKQWEVLWLGQTPTFNDNAVTLLTNPQDSVAFKGAYSRLSPYLEQLLAASSDITDVWILGPGGKVLFSTNEQHEGESMLTTYVILSHPTFGKGEQEIFVQNAYFSPVLLETITTIAIPITGDEGQFVGALAVHLNLGRLTEIMQERQGLGESGETFVVDRFGDFVSTPRFGEGQLPQGVHTQGIDAALNQEQGVNIYQNYRGAQVIGAYRWLDELELALLVEMEVREAFAPVRDLTIVMLAIGGIVMAVVLVFSYSLARRIFHPLSEVTSTAMQIAAGDLSRRAPVLTQDEIGALAIAFNDMTGRLQEMMGSLERRIAERKQAEEDLLRLQHLLQNITDSMPSALITLDTDGQVLTWNPAAEALTGQVADYMQGRSLWQACPELARYHDLFEQVLRDGQVAHCHRERSTEGQLAADAGAVYRDVSVFPLEANDIAGAVLRIDDVTRRVRLEEMMVQSEKMLSVGGLAAGMAHEINNPLAGMIQTANVMSNRLTNLELPANQRAAEEAGASMTVIRAFMESRSIPRMLAAINESGRRAAAIVDNMLSFSRRSEAVASTHNVADLLDKTVELAATDYDLKKQYDFKTIDIAQEYEADLPLVLCEEAKLQQVLLNVLRNGAQAMQEAGTKEPTFVLRTRYDTERGMVCIEIADNGPGMDEAVRKRVFEPFFTTKPVGVGTGLGLSVSYFIITENHGGEMEVVSEPGQGATFIIRMPVNGSTL